MARKKRNKKKLRWGRIGALVLVLVSFLVYFLYNQYQKEEERKQIEANRQVVKAMELRSVNEIEQRLREIKKNFGIGKISIDEIPNKKYFEDSIFMGDSMTEAIAVYDFLPPSNVVAAVGRNTKTALPDITLLTNLSPSRVFLWYGMNDLSQFGKADDFIASYSLLIDEIRAASPNSEIVILSLMPVADNAVKKQPELAPERIKAFNAGLKKMSQDKGLFYIDVTGVLKPDYYEPDGIHTKTVFYRDLFNFIKKEFIERG